MRRTTEPVAWWTSSKSSHHVVCLALYRPVAVRKEGNQQNEPSTIPEDAGEVQRSEAATCCEVLIAMIDCQP